MKLFSNIKISYNNDKESWTAKNGATRRTLMVINKLEKDIEANEAVECSLGYLHKGNHSFIFINKPKPGIPDDRIFGLFTNSSYSYSVEPIEAAQFEASSPGGCGNSESKFGIYSLNVKIICHSYKNRRGTSKYRLTPTGWVFIPEVEDIQENEQTVL